MKIGIQQQKFVQPLILMKYKLQITIGFLLISSLFLQGHTIAASYNDQSGGANPIPRAVRVAPTAGVRELDPNIYSYSADFAKRFNLSEDFSSSELTGVDAVAFRVIPSPYKTCGWGGDPNACREDETRCELDLYFDHKRNPLPWDERLRISDSPSTFKTSAFFVGGFPYRPHARNGSPLPRPPFTDPTTGFELAWQEYFQGNTVSGWMGIISYDKEVFRDMAMITLGANCNAPAQEIWLGHDLMYYQDIKSGTAIKKRIILPLAWQKRVVDTLRPYILKNNNFLKNQGIKAMKNINNPGQP